MELGTYFLGWISGLFVGICFGYVVECLITTYKRNCYIQSVISSITNPHLLKIVYDYINHHNRSGAESIINNLMRSNNTTNNKQNNNTTNDKQNNNTSSETTESASKINLNM